MEPRHIWNIVCAVLLAFVCCFIRHVQTAAISGNSVKSQMPYPDLKQASVYNEGSLAPKISVPPMLSDGDGFGFISGNEGDDIIHTEQLPSINSGDRRKKRKVDGKGWPNNEVPYEYNRKYRTYSAATKRKIQEAMQWWMDATCLKFRPARSSDSVKLSFSNNGGCRSYVGYQSDVSNGVQEIKLQESHCFHSVGTAAHEIGHSLGLIHEQSRKDRDEHIKIHVDRINSASLHNFQIFYPARIPKDVHYDLNSIMHYSPQSFASNPFISLPTMTATNPKKDVLMGQRNALGFYDAKGINVEYCQADCRDDCKNEGYAIFKDRSCRCVCPEGLTGRKCERVDSSCGGEITLGANGQKKIQSPQSSRGQKCVWLITAPKGYLVEINFNEFEVTKASGFGNGCKHVVEVRNNILGQRGDLYCGTGPLGPFNTMLDYKNHQMMVLLDTTDSSVSAGKGFKATVRAYKDACTSDPCQNQGTCTPVGSSDYKCNCPVGYQGKSCDKVKDAAVTCDFAEGMCNYRNDDSDQLDMQRMFTSRKYLEMIERNSNQNKFFLGAPVEFQTELKDKANLISPMFSGAAVPKRCLTFYYHMDGNYQAQGELYATVKGTNGQEDRIFNARGKQGARWKKVEKEIHNTGDYEVIITIQASDVYPYNSLIAIDDVSILPQSCRGGPCSRNPCQVEDSVCVEPDSGGYYCLCPPGKAGDRCNEYDISGYTCTFDDDTCGWTNDRRDNYEWVKSFGTADTQQRTGPKSGAGGKGFYMNADTSALGAGDGKKARLFSPKLNHRGSVCVEFYYIMYGSSVNALELKLATNNRAGSSLFRKTGEQGNDWIHASVDVSLPSASHQLLFEATSGSRHLSDIAVDEVKITRGTCSNPITTPSINPVTAPPTTTTTPAPPTAARRAPVPSRKPAIRLNRKVGNGDVLAECSFEQGQCEDDLVFFPSPGEYTWLRTNGETPSAGTGPEYAAEGSYYIFTEASDRDEGETLVVSTHLIYNRERKACISFDYHMDGTGTGSLTVKLKKERGDGENIWTKSGEQSENWLHADIDVTMSSSSFYQVLFEGTIGNSYTSDIALDNIKIVKGTCSSNKQRAENALSRVKVINMGCDFEGNHICSPNFKQKSDDDFDWDIRSGRTPTSSTGPDRAASGSRYLVIESSDKSPEDKAVIETATIPSGVGDICLKLQYHMHGQKIGKFRVDQVLSSGRRNKLFEKRGEQSGDWLSLEKTIPNSSDNYKIELIGQLSDTSLRYFGDMALDKISIRSGRC